MGDSKAENNVIVLKRTNAKHPEKAKNQEIIDIGTDMSNGDSDPVEIGKPTEYTIFLNELEVGQSEFKQGGNYNLLLSGVSGNATVQIDKVTPENSFNMFWQLPQYVIMTAGEVLFSITTMEFCFTQVLI